MQRARLYPGDQPVPWVAVRPVVAASMRSLCKRAYDGHPSGCPNFGVSPRCPPKAKHFWECFSDGPFYAIYSQFDLGAHVARMRAAHPGWTEKQLRCVLYWQGTARKKLRAEITRFLEVFPYDWRIEETPEAMGLVVHHTCLTGGRHLEWPPFPYVTHVAIAGLAAQ
jgi:hypothetical protein